MNKHEEILIELEMYKYYIEKAIENIEAGKLKEARGALEDIPDGVKAIDSKLEKEIDYIDCEARGV